MKAKSYSTAPLPSEVKACPDPIHVYVISALEGAYTYNG
jgi:hypothetical protein